MNGIRTWPRPVRLLVGVAAYVPLLSLLAFFAFFVQFVLDDRIGMPATVGLVVLLLTAAGVLVPVLTILFLWDALSRTEEPVESRCLWALIVVLVNALVFPFYWHLRVGARPALRHGVLDRAERRDLDAHDVP